MEEVRLTSSRIFIWPGIHAEVGENVRVLAPQARQVFIFTDRKCIPIAKRVAMALMQANFEVAGYAMYPGESRKNLRTALGVYNKMAKKKIDRGAAFVTVGGGVVTELGGYVANTYKDGLKLFHVPTSFVAQLDVGIGGKTGLNINEGRGFVSTAYSPEAVFVDPSLLETLPPKDYQAGLAEAVKYGMIREADLLTFLEENVEGLEARTPLLLEEIVYRCAGIKAAVEQESASSGVAAVLKYGWTVGRALQAAGGFSKIHSGEALAVGMEAEAWMAEKMGVAAPGVVKAQNRILRLLDLPTRVRGMAFDTLFQALDFDPKPVSAWPKFALPEAVGRANPGIEIPLEVLQEALKSILLPGGRMRAVRPMASAEETEPAAAEVPPPAAAT
ncbi:MAG: iron-containing alcohol dehydrogenase [Planctomycetota bacterium]|nr:MAG: iron-containing alcohol dehydrogenase [Planctomycetota bacterium]